MNDYRRRKVNVTEAFFVVSIGLGLILAVIRFSDEKTPAELLPAYTMHRAPLQPAQKPDGGFTL